MKRSIYELNETEVIEKISKFAILQECGVVRGLLVAAKLAGMDIKSTKFQQAIDNDIRKIKT